VNGKAHLITMHKKRKPSIKDGSVIYSIGSISPPAISSEAKNTIIDIANKIAKEFGFNNTPLLMQIIVSGDKASVVEFAPRIGGGLNFRKIKLFADFDILSASIDSYYGMPVDVKEHRIEFLYSENHIYVQPGVFGRIEGVADLIANGDILEFYQNKMQGMQIVSGNASKDRIGSFIVTGKNLEEVKTKVARVFKNIKVFDKHSKRMEYSYNYSNLLLE